MTKLFKPEDVKKFFNILERLSGGYSINESKQIYKGYDKKNPHIVQSQRHMFVNRTIAKWLKGKYLIIYRESDLGIQYKQYVSITTLRYENDWSSTGHIRVGLLDYAKSYHSGIFDSGDKFNHNACLDLEGEWCDNTDKHHLLLGLIGMKDVQEKEFIVKAYDFSKYPKRKKKGVDPMSLITTTVSIKAKTYHEFYKNKEAFQKNCFDTKSQLTLGDIIEIKDL